MSDEILEVEEVARWYVACLVRTEVTWNFVRCEVNCLLRHPQVASCEQVLWQRLVELLHDSTPPTSARILAMYVEWEEHCDQFYDEYDDYAFSVGDQAGYWCDTDESGSIPSSCYSHPPWAPGGAYELAE